MEENVERERVMEKKRIWNLEERVRGRGKGYMRDR